MYEYSKGILGGRLYHLLQRIKEGQLTIRFYDIWATLYTSRREWASASHPFCNKAGWGGIDCRKNVDKLRLKGTLGYVFAYFITLISFALVTFFGESACVLLSSRRVMMQ